MAIVQKIKAVALGPEFMANHNAYAVLKVKQYET
jgi:hypothetical protein